MNSTPLKLSPRLQAEATSLGTGIRRQRKALKVTAVAAAEAAGMSRVTWHRVERGEVSVSFGAYLLAANVVGLSLGLLSAKEEKDPDGAETIPVRIALADYPQLKQIAWQTMGVDTLSPLEALNIYERNWRYIDEAALTLAERSLINALRRALPYGEGHDGSNPNV